MKEFFTKNKVFIAGVTLAILTSAYELFSKGGDASPWIIGWSVFIAGTSFAARNLRAQWATIFTALTSTLIAFISLHNSPNDLTLKQVATEIFLPVSIAVVGAFFSSPSKPLGYEQTAVIENAKAQGQAITDDAKNN